MKIYLFSILFIFSYLFSNYEVFCYNCLVLEFWVLICDLFELELVVLVRIGCSIIRFYCVFYMLG